MKKQSIDNLFADKLQQAKISPRPEAWEKLQSKMAKKETKIVWLPFVKWSAAASVVLLVSTGIWLMNDIQQPKITTLAQTKTPTKKAISRPQIIQSEILAKTTPTASLQAIPAVKLTNVTISNQTITQKPTTQNNVATQSEVIVAKNEKGDIEPINKKIETVATEPKLETIAAIVPTPEKTVILELTEPTALLSETVVANIKPDVISALPKEKRISKIFQQLKNLKNGDDIDWKEVGVKSPKLLARLNKNQD